jgi:hypothetical protein
LYYKNSAQRIELLIPCGDIYAEGLRKREGCFIRGGAVKALYAIFIDCTSEDEANVQLGKHLRCQDGG